MSLVDLILGQKGILISLGLALLLLFVALLLGATGRLRASSAKRKRRKAKQAAMVAAQVTQLDQSSHANAPITAKAHVQPISDIAPTPSQVTSTAGAVKATPVTSTVVTAPPEGQVEGQLSGAMQDILSSVFVDEDAVARYEVLLRDLDNIEISDLLTLCQQVTRQLGAGMMPTANKEQ